MCIRDYSTHRIPYERQVVKDWEVTLLSCFGPGRGGGKSSRFVQELEGEKWSCRIDAAADDQYIIHDPSLLSKTKSHAKAPGVSSGQFCMAQHLTA